MLDNDGVMFLHRFYMHDQIFSFCVCVCVCVCVEDNELCAYVIYTDMNDREPRRPCIILVMCKK